MKPETTAIHTGLSREAGAIAPPLHLSTTFEHDPVGEPLGAHIYIRTSHPNGEALETRLAALEGGAQAVAYASGMGAVAAYLQSLPPGTQVLFHTALYFHVAALARDRFATWGLTARAVDFTDLEALDRAIGPETGLLWFETPSNPAMDVIDIAAVAARGRACGALTLVDSTFTSPAVQRPLDLGADAVMHSATKFMGGHSDVQGGALILKDDPAHAARLKELRTLTGGVLAPFNAWLIARGLTTLHCRLERQSATALAIAQALEGHASVERVRYPGLASHPGHAIARRQMRGGGAMLAFDVKGGAQAALAVAGRLRLIVNATSLGGVETLIEHRASIEGPDSKSPPGLLRVSVGLEHPDDLIADLLQALG